MYSMCLLLFIRSSLEEFQEEFEDISKEDQVLLFMIMHEIYIYVA